MRNDRSKYCLFFILITCILILCFSGCTDTTGTASSTVSASAEGKTDHSPDNNGDGIIGQENAAVVKEEREKPAFDYYLIDQLIAADADRRNSGNAGQFTSDASDSETAEAPETAEDNTEEAAGDLTCTDIAIGKKHALLLLSDGHVIATGIGGYGTGKWSRITAVSAGDDHSVGLKSDGTVVAVGYGQGEYNELQVEDWKDIVSIGAGKNYTAGLDRDHVLHTAGEDPCYYDQNAFDHTHVRSFYAGEQNLAVVYEDGSFYVAGQDDFDYSLNKRILKAESEWIQLCSISWNEHQMLGLNNEGIVTAVGDESAENVLSLDVDGQNHVIQIAAGTNFSICLKDDGSIFASGKNEFGQCGVVNWKNIKKIDVWGKQILGLRSDGKVLTAGSNKYGACTIPESCKAMDVRQSAALKWYEPKVVFDKYNDMFYGEVHDEGERAYWPVGFCVWDYGGLEGSTSLGFNICDSYSSESGWTGPFISLYRNKSGEVDSIAISKTEEGLPVYSQRFWSDGNINYLDWTQEPNILYKKQAGEQEIKAVTVTGLDWVKGNEIDTGNLTEEDLERMGFKYKNVEISSVQHHYDHISGPLHDGIWILSSINDNGEKIQILRVEISPEGNVGIDYKGQQWGFDASEGRFLGDGMPSIP